MTARNADDAALGPLVAEHETTAAGFLKVGALVAFSLLVACGLLGLGLLSHDSNIVGRVIASLLGLIFALPAALGIYGLLRSRDNGIFIHERGLMIRKAGVESRVLWDDIAGYDGGLFLIIGTKKEESFEFGMDGIRAGDVVVAALREEVAVKRVMPLMKAKLLEGKTGSFESDAQEEGEEAESSAGATHASELVAGVSNVPGFTMDALGLTPIGSEQVIPWGEVQSWRSEEKTRDSGRLATTTHFVVVDTAETTFRVVMNAMSNRDAFLALCAAMTAGNEGNPEKPGC